MRTLLRWVAVSAGLALVVTAGLGWAAYRKFSDNIRTDSAAERVLARYAAERPPVLVPGARNILVMGTADGARGGDGEPEAAVLLHLSADRRRAAAVGVPRELMVAAPRCARPGGGTTPAAYEPFGAAFRSGAACSIRAFERLSGIRIDHHLVVDVAGFQKIAGAVGGRAVDARGDLPQALARGARGGDGGLAHPARLYGFLDTATSSITADPGLSSLPALYDLAGSLRRLPAGGLVLRTVPVARHGVPRQPGAGELFQALRADRPLSCAACARAARQN
ncbi:LCP family protein [Actinacidiphila sp. ITFR-21]|uniref:LCP family protein n=1 Tax=Actinacidiphila sp. ITFR-21 TaxID=3075199 RepID=UPI00288B655E|nr:LCP family protein [Streptomyces sp. ITFR-21]WNI16847.1 LCP family protein [Streptomyces sp. ITFR-21]